MEVLTSFQFLQYFPKQKNSKHPPTMLHKLQAKLSSERQQIRNWSYLLYPNRNRRTQLAHMYTKHRHARL